MKASWKGTTAAQELSGEEEGMVESGDDGQWNGGMRGVDSVKGSSNRRDGNGSALLVTPW